MSDAFSLNTTEKMTYLNPFQAYAPFLYPMKTSKNLWFSNFFRGYGKETLA